MYAAARKFMAPPAKGINGSKEPENPRICSDTPDRYLCDKTFTNRILKTKATITSIVTTTAVIGSGSYGAIRSAELYMKQHDGLAFTCIGVQKTSLIKGGLTREIINEIACYSRLQGKPCISLGLFMKLTGSQQKTIMEHYLCDLHHLFYSIIKPRERDQVALNRFVTAIVYQMLTGLKIMHDENIIHRDLKPANILLSQHGDIVLADFGLSEYVPIGFNHIQRYYNMAGTPHYMPPEVFMGRGYDSKIDIWSIGSTAYEMLTGNYLIDDAFLDRIPKENQVPYFEAHVKRMLSVSMSPPMRQLLSGLLNTDHSKRPSATEALRYPCFQQMNIDISRKIILESLSDVCIIKTKQKVNATKKRGNRNTNTNSNSVNFFRIEQVPGWTPVYSDERTNIIQAFFDGFVIQRAHLSLSKFLHTIEMYDRFAHISTDLPPDLSVRYYYLLGCAVIADTLSELGGNSLTSKNVTHDIDMEGIIRDILFVLSGDVFPLKNGLLQRISMRKPTNAREFLTDMNQIATLNIILNINLGRKLQNFDILVDQFKDLN